MLIKLEKISKIYRLGEIDIPAVQGVSLEIDKGEFVAIMGASGSGKTTLMNIIGCLDNPTSGQYLLENKEITKLSRDEQAYIRNKKLGFVFQNFNLLARTSALENVELPLFYGDRLTHKQKLQRAKEMLKRLGLESRLYHYPSQLSGGEQQRVAIARALVNQPALILADEPTGNLDSKTSQEIMTLFSELNKEGITVIVITHEKNVALCAKRVITIKDGMII